MVTIQEGFQRPFPNEILGLIIAKTDRKSLPACLRVSSQWFHLAGKVLYPDIVIGWSGAAKLMRGAGISRPLSARSSDIAHQKPKDAKTGFKRQLLEYVQTITIKGHTCPTEEADRSALTRGAKLMTGLKQTILSPQARFTETLPLCGNQPGCPILAGIECHSVTIQSIRRQGPSGHPLEDFSPIFDHVEHATLVIQPLVYYIGTGQPAELSGGNWPPQDLVLSTRNLQSVRILVAISHGEAALMEEESERTASFASLGPLQSFLASFINLHPSRIEIYMFNDPSDLGRSTKTFDEFKEQLAISVDQTYRNSIKRLTESKELKAEHSSWSPNYQVFDLEHYFAQPDLSFELENWMGKEWQKELERLREPEMEWEELLERWERDRELKKPKQVEREPFAKDPVVTVLRVQSG